MSSFTPAVATTGTISGATLTMNVNNAGEYSDLTFTFKNSNGYAVGETIDIIFPSVFDPFVGSASQWFGQESGSYYLNCESASIGLAWCTVDKWKVTIAGSVAVEAASNIDITIKYVALPATGVTTEKVMLAVRDATGLVTAVAEEFVSTGIDVKTVPANNINIASVMASSHKLFGLNATYTFNFMLA